MKATDGWNGLDTYEFTALLGGYGHSYFDDVEGLWFSGIDINGFWWTASERTGVYNIHVYTILMYGDYDHADLHPYSRKFEYKSVRCLKDGSAGHSYSGKGNDISNYRIVTIGDQVWMAENLDYNVNGSKCYDNQDYYCAWYGRLYDWATAMALPSDCNSSTCASLVNAKHQGICPDGWHLPSNDEWDALYHYADGTSNIGGLYDSPTAGRYLKATSGWIYGENDGNGLDSYGFAALPSGMCNYDGSIEGAGGFSSSFESVGSYSIWWSSDEYDASDAYDRYMHYINESAGWNHGGKSSTLQSVRCLQD